MPKQGEALLSGRFLLEAVNIGIGDGECLGAPFTNHLAVVVSHGFVVGDTVALMDAAGNTGFA